MRHPSKTEAAKDAVIAGLIFLVAVCFSGLCEPWLPVLCGIGTAFRLDRFNIRLRSFVFPLMFFPSLLEDRWWFLGPTTIAFAATALLTTWILELMPRLAAPKAVRMAAEALPVLLVIGLMPLPSLILLPHETKTGLIDSGVWAKPTPIPVGQEALATKYQYGYERFRQIQNAEIVGPGATLSQFNELILITPTTPFEDAFASDLHDWTSKGGKLLIVADHTNLFGHQIVLKPILEKFGIATRPDAIFETDTNGGIYRNLMVKYAGLTPSSISKGVIPRLKMSGWSEDPDYTASSFFGELQPSNDDVWGHHAVLGSKRCGLGEITVFTDSTFFANFAINRWSSNSVMSSIFWPRASAISSILAMAVLLAHLCRPSAMLLSCSLGLTLLAPSLGFAPKPAPSGNVSLRPPDTVENQSEERDQGTGSALLASAYAFDLSIRWNSTAKTSFQEHIQANGIHLQYPASANSVDLATLPQFDIGQITNGRFYLDQNSFWYGQGAGIVRTANAANCWKALGITMPVVPALTVTETAEIKLRNSSGQTFSLKVAKMADNWAILDDRFIGKWVPEAGKWLVRKEWQLGPWLKNDLLFENVQ